MTTGNTDGGNPLTITNRQPHNETTSSFYPPCMQQDAGEAGNSPKEAIIHLDECPETPRRHIHSHDWHCCGPDEHDEGVLRFTIGFMCFVTGVVGGVLVVGMAGYCV